MLAAVREARQLRPNEVSNLPGIGHPVASLGESTQTLAYPPTPWAPALWAPDSPGGASAQ